MRIAVPYENGSIFQHFGRTESFKLYDVVDGSITSCELLKTPGQGHAVLADFLSEFAVNVVICGGIGNGAQSALAEEGIEIVSGIEGKCDDAVAAYIRGKLESAGVNCDHHCEDDECGCGGDCECDDEQGCGSCGHCGGGCGGCKPPFEGKNVGHVCRVHYRGTLNDGSQFDSSYDRGEPLEFVCGGGMMILGFDAAVATMDVGEIRDIHLMPEEAYGPSDPRAIFTIEIAKLPGSEDLSVGQQVYLSNAYGQPVPVKVVAKDETNITLDANHEMAGKELNFRIELVEVK